MPKLYYPNCSELIADFNSKNVKEFFRMVDGLRKKYGWHFDPPLTEKVLEKMKFQERLLRFGADDLDRTRILVVDKKGRTTMLEYGSNGYDNTLGFRFDSGCNDHDSSQFEFFDTAIRECQAKMKCYDGGSLDSFEEWQKGKI